MSTDEELIKRKIKLIERDLKKIKKISLIPYSDYAKNSDLHDLAERNLERAIGRLIDINYHILTQEKEVMPKDYYNSFLLMGEHGFLPLELAQSMANSAGLRNRLAHEYDEIEPKKIYQALQRSINEIPQYLKEILNLMEKNSASKKLF